MSEETENADVFQHAESFTAGEVGGGLGLGPLEQQYQELFAEALDDGVITAEERARLEKAADNLGLNPQRLLQLEQAMVAAYEARHAVRIVEHYEEGPASLAPIRVEAGGDAEKAMLLKRIEQLEARVAELQEELREAQANINVEVDISDLEEEPEEDEEAEPIFRRIRRDPTKPDHYHKLFKLFGRQGNVDAQFCVAQALTLLGAAEGDEKAIYEQHRSHTLITAKVGLSQDAWYDYLFHPEEEVLTGQIFGVIAPAVLIGRVTTLRRDKLLHIPNPEAKQDPQKSTITAVRALNWAAALLGLAAPSIYVEKDREVGFEHIPGVPPVSVLGKKVLSRRTQLQHAFMAGRHLCGYRQEHFVKTLFTAVPDLEDLFLAALSIGSPSLPIAEGMKARVKPIANAIQPLLEPSHVDALRGHFLRFMEDGGRTNLQRWSAAVDKTQARAGMLLCNDLPTAAGVLGEEGDKLGELTQDLLTFVVSEGYFKLRRQLGIAVGQ